MGFLQDAIESGHYADYYLAFSDELSIEARVIRLKDEADRDEWAHLEYAESKRLLRKIDELKASGAYEIYRKELRKRPDLQDGPLARAAQSWAAAARLFSHPDVRNVLAGRQSPDPDQRARFQGVLDDHIGDMTPREAQSLLACLERAKLPKGRPSLPAPWANEIKHMDAMRLAVSAGMAIAEAARTRAEAEGKAGQNNRAGTLARLYRAKMALRN